MRKFLFALIGFAIVIPACVPGGKASKSKVVETSQEPAQVAVPTNFVVYREKEIPVRIEFGLHNNLFPSTEIRLEGDIHNKMIITQDGKNFNVDSIIPLRYVIHKDKPGELTGSPIKDQNGHILEINLSFDEGDASFDLSFRRRVDGAFTLNGNATINYYGIPYDVIASSVGECILLIDYTPLSVPTPEYKEAAGRKASGTYRYKIK
jgi:hypothetical protein